MILEAILNLIKGALTLIIGLLPSVSISLPGGFLEWFTNIVISVGYFLPISDMVLMFGIWLVVVNFNIIWKVIQRVWDALPFT